MESAEYEIRLRDSFSQGLGKLEGRMNKFESKVGGLGQSIAGVFAGVSLAGIASNAISFVGDLAKSVVSLGADAEMTRVSFTTMLGGDSARAGQLIKDIQDLGAKTVFTSSQINKQAQLLLNYGTNVEDVIPTLTQLGDVSAGNIDNFQGLTRAFGQIQATGRLMGQDLNQLINAGFNPLQEMSKKTGKSMATLKKEMEDGAISFQDVKDAFKQATSEGGRFYKLNETLSKTLSGRFSTLKDNIERLGITLGTKLLPVLGGVVDFFADLVSIIPKIDLSPYISVYEDFWMEIKELFSSFQSLFGLWSSNITTFDIITTAIRYLAFSLRTSLLPIKFMIEAYTEFMILIKGSMAVFTGLGQVLKGVFTGNLDLIKKGVDTVGGSVINLGTKLKESAGDFIMREAKGYAKIFSPYDKKGANSTDAATGKGGLSGSGGARNATGTAGKEIGVEKIQAGTRNVVVNIQKLIENVTFEKGYKDSEAKLQEMVTKALLVSVNDVNIVSQ